MGLQVATTVDRVPTRGVARAKALATKRLTAFPKAAPYDCPALVLLAEHEEVLRLFNEEDRKIVSGRGSRTLRTQLEKRLFEITEEVSYCSPRSFDGAAFQILVAHCETGECDWPAATEERFNRLVYRAMDHFGIGLDAFPITRKYFMPAALDPKLWEAP